MALPQREEFQELLLVVNSLKSRVDELSGLQAKVDELEEVVATLMSTSSRTISTSMDASAPAGPDPSEVDASSNYASNSNGGDWQNAEDQSRRGCRRNRHRARSLDRPASASVASSLSELSAESIPSSSSRRDGQRMPWNSAPFGLPCHRICM